MNKMEILPGLTHKDVIGNTKCADCGKPVDVCVAKNGGLYAFCQWSDDYGKPCAARRWYGAKLSMEMQIAHLKHVGKPVPEPETRDKKSELWFDQ